MTLSACSGELSRPAADGAADTARADQTPADVSMSRDADGGAIAIADADADASSGRPDQSQLTTYLLQKLRAFPTALGFGKHTTGGRGGKVVLVTNLNTSGVGSLDAALKMTGARTIVFTVGGTIRYSGSAYPVVPPGSGDLTIAGETAPGDGILIRGGRLRIEAGNVIVRHLRVRQDPVNSTGTNDDAVTLDGTVNGPITNLLLDHVSISYGLDGNLDIRNTRDCTVQYSLFTANDKSNLINANTKDLSYLRNIFALVHERAVRANTIAHLDLTYEMINNYVYGVNWPGGPSEGLKVTVENNVCEASNDYAVQSSSFVSLTAPNPANNEPNTIGNTYLYVSGNDLGDAYSNALKPSIDAKYIFSKPLYRSEYMPLPTSGLKAMLVDSCGAYHTLPQGLDSVDAAVIANIKAKTGTIAYSGPFPSLNGGSAPADANSDGIPDAFAAQHGISSPTQIKTDWDFGSYKVRNSAGYTALEMYLFSLTGDLIAGADGTL